MVCIEKGNWKGQLKTEQDLDRRSFLFIEENKNAAGIGCRFGSLSCLQIIYDLHAHNIEIWTQ